MNSPTCPRLCVIRMKGSSDVGSNICFLRFGISFRYFLRGSFCSYLDLYSFFYLSFLCFSNYSFRFLAYSILFCFCCSKNRSTLIDCLFLSAASSTSCILDIVSPTIREIFEDIRLSPVSTLKVILAGSSTRLFSFGCTIPREKLGGLMGRCFI